MSIHQEDDAVTAIEQQQQAVDEPFQVTNVHLDGKGEDDDDDEQEWEPSTMDVEDDYEQFASQTDHNNPLLHTGNRNVNLDIFDPAAGNAISSSSSAATVGVDSAAGAKTTTSSSFVPQRRRGGQIQMRTIAAADAEQKNSNESNDDDDDDDEDGDGEDSYHVPQGQHSSTEAGASEATAAARMKMLKSSSNQATATTAATDSADHHSSAVAPFPHQNLTFESNQLVDYSAYEKRLRIQQAVSNFVKACVDIANAFPDELRDSQKNRIPICAVYRATNFLGTQVIGVACLAAKHGFCTIFNHITVDDIDHSNAKVALKPRALSNFTPANLLPGIPTGFYPGNDPRSIPDMLDMIRLGINPNAKPAESQNRNNKSSARLSTTATGSQHSSAAPVELSTQEKAFAEFVKKTVKKHGQPAAAAAAPDSSSSPVPEGESSTAAPSSENVRCGYNKIFEIFSASITKKNPDAEKPSEAGFNTVMAKLSKAGEFQIIGPLGGEHTFIRVGRRERHDDEVIDNNDQAANNENDNNADDANPHQQQQQQQTRFTEKSHVITDPMNAPPGVICRIHDPSGRPGLNYYAWRDPTYAAQSQQEDSPDAAENLMWYIMFDFDIFLPSIKLAFPTEPVEYEIGDWYVLSYNDPQYPTTDPATGRAIPDRLCLPIVAKGRCRGPEHQHQIVTCVAKDKEKIFRWKEPRGPESFAGSEQYTILQRATRAALGEAKDCFSIYGKDVAQICERIAREKKIPLSIHRVIIQSDFRRIYVFYTKHEHVEFIRSASAIPELLFFELTKVFPSSSFTEETLNLTKIFMLEVGSREGFGRLPEPMTYALMREKRKNYAHPRNEPVSINISNPPHHSDSRYRHSDASSSSYSPPAASTSQQQQHSIPGGWENLSKQPLPTSHQNNNNSSNNYMNSTSSYSSQPPQQQQQQQQYFPPQQQQRQSSPSRTIHFDPKHRVPPTKPARMLGTRELFDRCEDRTEAVFAIIRVSPYHFELHHRGKSDFKLDELVVCGHGEFGADVGRVVAIGIQNTHTHQIVRMIQNADRIPTPITRVCDESISKILRNANEKEEQDFLQVTPRKDQERADEARRLFETERTPEGEPFPYKVVGAHVQKDDQVTYIYLDCQIVAYSRGPLCKGICRRLHTVYNKLIRPLDITNHFRALNFAPHMQVEMYSKDQQNNAYGSEQQQQHQQLQPAQVQQPYPPYHQQPYQQLRVIPWAFGPNPLLLPPPFFAVPVDPTNPYDQRRQIFRRPIGPGLMLAPPPMIVQRY